MYSMVERARDGEPAAVSHLAAQLRPRISKMAGYYARRTGEDSNDLLQEAWLGLLEALPGVDVGIGQPEQYLIRHARWRMLDAVKRARVRRTISLEEAMLPEMDPSAEDPLAEALVSEFARRLKPNQRAVLRCLMSGLTWRETGDALGCTSPNIAYHVREIRKRYQEWDSAPLARA